jgi:hypothetical protein
MARKSDPNPNPQGRLEVPTPLRRFFYNNTITIKSLTIFNWRHVMPICHRISDTGLSSSSNRWRIMMGETLSP